LGFRGEALASAAQVSRSLVITTRVEGEATAVSCKIAKNGDIQRFVNLFTTCYPSLSLTGTSEKKVSSPVGTSVRVENYLEHLPVRKEQALKQVTKQLLRVKSMLQAYALAYPHVRLELKVLKAKTEKGNWTYAPGRETTLEQAVVKVFGIELAGQCIPTVYDNHDDGYKIQAVLCKPDSRKPIISWFISLDYD